MKMIKKMKKGFTLIELVVVIAVIAILSAVSVVAYVGITNNAKKSAAQSEASQIVTTIRAGVLASADGYDETGKAEGQTLVYHVDLDGRELKITKDAADERSEEDLIKDMLIELGEPGLSEKEIDVKTENKVTEIGVQVQGKEGTYVYAAF